MAKKARTTSLPAPPVEEDIIWLEAPESCDVRLCIIPHRQAQQQHQQQHELQEQSPCGQVFLYASSQLLSRIPYFSTSLSEPWQAQVCPRDGEVDGNRELLLECAASTTPADYNHCLQFLKPDEFGIPCVDVALRVLRSADHLLFQECADECMAYLAGTAVLDTDLGAIQQAISSIGLKPSPDLVAKLETKDDIGVFKEVLLDLVRSNDCADFKNFIEHIFMSDTPQEFARACAGHLMEVWISLTDASSDRGLEGAIALDMWIALFKEILQHGDSKALLEAFAVRSNDLKEACLRRLESIDHWKCLRSFIGDTSTPQEFALIFAAVLKSNEFKEAFLRCVQHDSAGFKMFMEQYTFNDALQEFARNFTAGLMEVWISLTRDAYHVTAYEFRKWIAVTEHILEHGDVKALLEAFAFKSHHFPSRVTYIALGLIDFGYADVLRQVFLRAVPTRDVVDEKQTRMILLSNSTRAAILAAWAPVVVHLEDTMLTLAFNEVVFSLPPQEPIVVKIMKENRKHSMFKPCFTRWKTSFFQRMKTLRHVEEEPTLLPNKRIKLRGTS